MNGNATDIVAICFALASMEAGTDFDAQGLDLLDDSASAADAARRAVESGLPSATLA